MILSTSLGDLYDRHGIKESIRILAAAGYDAYDFSFRAFKDPLFETDAIAAADSIRAYADSLGIVCNQAHAPFPTSVGDAEKDEAIFQSIVRSMEIASHLGAKIIVIHPKQHLTYAEHAEELYRLNMDFYQRLFPYCEKLGIKIATENMWQWNGAAGACTDSTCSRAWEFCKYIDDLNSPYIVGCLDIGHVSLMGTDIPDFIRAMGNKRLCALHIHDTDGKDDCHTLPYIESIDWDKVTAALGEIDYQGDFTFETLTFCRRFPEELATDTEAFMCKVGRHLISLVERSRRKEDEAPSLAKRS